LSVSGVRGWQEAEPATRRLIQVESGRGWPGSVLGCGKAIPEQDHLKLRAYASMSLWGLAAW